MDNDQQVQVIEAGLDALDGMQLSDERSARGAFTQVMVTVNRINQLSTQTRAQAMMGAGARADDVLDKLRDWLDRLVSALTQIVGKLPGATSFSISVGASVSVTVDFARPAPRPTSPLRLRPGGGTAGAASAAGGGAAG